MKTFLQPDKPHALLFDIDNTLYRNDEYIRSQVDGQIRRFCEVRGIDPAEGHALVRQTKAELERVEGRRPSLANTLVALGVPIADSIQWRLELIVPETFLSVDDALHQTLSRLRGHVPLAALTNNPHEIGVRSLRALGIDALFDAVTGLDDSGESKPSWGPFQHALTQLHVPVGGVLMIGDRYDVDLEPVICRGGGAILVESREDVSCIPDLLEERYALSGRG